MRSAVSLAVVVVAALPAAVAGATEWPEANPGRPSFSTNATTTSHGALELETGAAIDPDVTGIMNQLKYGLLERFDVRLNYNQVVAPDAAVDALGVQVKWCLKVPDEGVLGLGIAPYYTVPLHDGDPHQLGNAFIATYPFAGGFQIDANVVVGASVGGTADDVLELDPVATLSIPLVGDLGGYLEGYALIPLAEGSARPVAAAAGLGYAVAPNLVLDAGIDVGLTDAAPDYLIQFGLTVAMNVK